MRKFLGEILVEMEVCTEKEINDALKKQMEGDSRPIGEILVTLQFCQPEHVARALAQQYELRFVDLEVLDLPAQVVSLIPQEVARTHTVIPVSLRDRTLTVAMANPLDLGVIDSLRFTTSQQIEAAVASERQIKAAIERAYGVTESRVEQMLGELTEQIEYRNLEQEVAGAGADDAPVIRYVTQIIQNAVTAEASDIHIEPMNDRLRIRYRIDGVCVCMDPAPKRLMGPVLQRIKILSGMMVEEKRKPQDGRIKATIAGRNIDMRVSSLPAIHGESMVMRILDQDSLRLNLTDMGFDPTDLRVYEELIRRPNGIILVTGPTGSGKTTTLYATLYTLNTTDRKIITAEDPVEYHLAGINQCPVRERIGMTFARILRAMLRQAPNVILVGEIRDAETANTAINAALTGHLVFSTLHTNDAPNAITRLIDLGVPPFLVATSIQAVLAQRLVRTVCPRCAKPVQPDQKMLTAIRIRPDQLEGRTLREGKGCEFCNNTGYRGRKGIFELMVMNRQLRNLAFDKAPTSEIRKAAIANGMTTLFMDGARKVLEGTTTIAEVLSEAGVDE